MNPFDFILFANAAAVDITTASFRLGSVSDHFSSSTAAHAATAGGGNAARAPFACNLSAATASF
jgi:hypothetical protein